MDGSELFWTSGTWLLFLGQVVALAVIVALYVYQGRKEAQARESRRSPQRPDRAQEDGA